MIDPIVQKWSTHFAGASKMFPIYISCIIFAEGGMTRIVKAVQCSQPSVQTVDEAVEDTCRSFVHRMADDPAIDGVQVLTVMGGFWAPVGAANDPHDLNVNWVKNATEEYEKLIAELQDGAV